MIQVYDIEQLYVGMSDDELTLSLILTKKCNNCCDHCMYSCGPDESGMFMKHDVLMSVIDWRHKLIENHMGVRINLIGGEPTLYMRKFANVVDIISRYTDNSFYGEYDIDMTTNGWWLQKPKTIRMFLDAVEPLLGRISVRISNSDYHNAFWKSETDRISLYNSVFSDEFGLFDYGIYNEDEYIPDGVVVDRNNPWIFVGSKLTNDSINNVGRAYYSGCGYSDAGTKNRCFYDHTVSILPSGKTFDGCSFGSDMPFGSVKDHPLVIYMLNEYFKHYVRDKYQSCGDCIDSAYEWRKSRDFLKTKRIMREFVNLKLVEEQ